MSDQVAIKTAIGSIAETGPNGSTEGLSRLLIIEDAVIHSTIIARIAEQIGYVTSIARSFDAASSLLRQCRFDCITLDLGLGEHAGVEVLRLLSTIACKTPIIIISGSEQAICHATVKIAKALHLNVYEPVRKPIDLKALREKLAQVNTVSRLAKFAAPIS